MTKVGIRQLSDHTSEIARRVREDHETIELTFRGEVFARIEPVIPKELDLSFEERWERRRKMAEALSEYWPAGLSAADAIAEDRR